MSKPEDWYWLCVTIRVCCDWDCVWACESVVAVDEDEEAPRSPVKTGGGTKSDILRTDVGRLLVEFVARVVRE